MPNTCAMKRTGSLKYQGGTEWRFLWPDHAKCMLSEVVPLASGISLVITNHTPDRDIAVAYDFSDAPLTVGFTLSGSSQTEVREEPGRSRVIEHTGYGAELSYVPNTRGVSILAGGIAMTTVSLVATPEILRCWAGEAAMSFPTPLLSLIEGNKDVRFRSTCPITPAMQSALHQILHCPYTGPLRRAYLDAKATELLVYRLEALLGEGTPPRHSLHEEDRRRVRTAGDVLADQLVSPPTVPELARLVGVNECKLKQGFKAVFGCTVRSYLVDRRFERAAWLLTSSDLCVPQVAEAVGYSDLKHFYGLFKARFGMPPGAYRKRTPRPPVSPQ